MGKWPADSGNYEGVRYNLSPWRPNTSKHKNPPAHYSVHSRDPVGIRKRRAAGRWTASATQCPLRQIPRSSTVNNPEVQKEDPACSVARRAAPACWFLVGFVVLQERLVDMPGAEHQDDAGSDLDQGERGAHKEGLPEALPAMAVVALALHMRIIHVAGQ